ncbi:hypothetical protein [uncultured Rhodoferax sp.]|uniref:hypothetical protein n=1 Tax=uncultured Rhodoferax sp. TaxID=223188 RepID=UPI0025CE3476|nr:hypothetical protein [uncultured Rhodoferax sp.]
MKKPTEVESLRHIARVFLAQSRHFSRRGHRAFAFTLLDMAANARRLSALQTAPQQELFK